MLTADIAAARHPDHPADALFVNRWSPRAMSGEPITDAELFTLLEAARWAPSSYNGQPWRIVYARRDTPHWPRLFSLLVPFNQEWCARAAALLVFIARATFEHNNKPNTTHAFDTGAAWENLALQGSLMRLVVHGMVGFDAARAATDLGVPDGFHVLAMAAIGRPGRREDLPESLRSREVPSTRKSIREFAFEGRFGG